MGNIIKWVQGNPLKLAIPLQKVTITQEGKTTEDYIPLETETIKVVLESNKSYWRKYEYTPKSITENVIVVEDDSELPVGKYDIVVLVLENDKLKRRSKWLYQIEVFDSNEKVLDEYDDFPDYASGALLDSAIFFFAKGDKGDKGDPLTWEDLTEEQKAEIKGEKGDKGDTGEGFAIYKTYSSIASMVADKNNVPLGKFTLIASDVDDEDNAKLYVRVDGIDPYVYLTDLSGAKGIKGDKGDKGDKGEKNTMDIVVNNTNISLLTTECGMYYRLGTPVDDLTITLPTIDDATSVGQVDLFFTTSATPNITFDSGVRTQYANSFVFESTTTYEVCCKWNGVAWVIDKKELKENRVVAKFNAASTSNATQIINPSYMSQIIGIEIDGVQQPQLVSSYIFETIGEHIVKYTLANPKIVKENTFRGCSSLTSVRIPEGVTTLGNNAFNNCSSLTNIDIPESLTNIGAFAFTNTPWYEDYSTDENNRYGNIIYINNVAYQAISNSIESCTFKENTISIGTSAFLRCNRLTSVTIPDSVELIGGYAFDDCDNLSSVTIGNGVKRIENGAFGSCDQLTEIVIPNNVKSIGNSVFSYSNLQSITIGSGVESIGMFAFEGCSYLNSITILAEQAPTVEDITFYNIGTNGTLYVPQGSTGYNEWMQNAEYYLGQYGWTLQISE